MSITITLSAEDYFHIVNVLLDECGSQESEAVISRMYSSRNGKFLPCVICSNPEQYRAYYGAKGYCIDCIPDSERKVNA